MSGWSGSATGETFTARGEYNPNRIGDALAAREFNATLRQMGVITGGPSAFSPKDRSKFASALDAAVNRMARETGKRSE